MACINPPALGDDQLLLFLDGEADQSIQAHIAACTYCRAQADSLDNLQAKLAAGLYRRDCPTPQELGDYQLKLTSADQSRLIKAHLQDCHHCAQELEQLTRYLSELTPDLSASAKTRLKIFVARLASGLEGTTGGMIPAPILAGIRGEAGGPLRYVVDDFEITIEVQPDPASPARLILLGLVLGDVNPGYTAILFREGVKVTSAPFDSLGNFILQDLEAGVYDLVLQGNQVEIHIPGLEVSSTRN